ncbi:MAG: hypothetical protein M1816_004910 [Peltula sp. TS41687]|nr:MAG: hypothetical protein M1816_004910 [Peltula sp. TS41687]
MDARVKQIVKVGILVFSCIVLVYTLRTLYYSDQLIKVQSVAFPGILRIGSWSSSSWEPGGTTVQDETGNDGASPTEEVVRPAAASGPFSVNRRATVGKVTIITGGPNPTYERALKTHRRHDRLHGYPLYVLRQGILESVWSKPAYILSLLLKELSRPESERLKWLLWFDADTVIMNPQIPLEIFLPPADNFDEIHLLVTNDSNGLNNGVFPIRVHPWSVELMSAIISFPILRPDTRIKFRDQSALEELITHEARFSKHTMHVPQRWFNAFQSGMMFNETIAPHEIRRGDLLVHFAGTTERETKMSNWMDLAEQHLPEWELDLKSTSYEGEIRTFWAAKQAEIDAARQHRLDVVDAATALISAVEAHLVAFGNQLAANQTGNITQHLHDLRLQILPDQQQQQQISNDGATEVNITLIAQAADSLKEATAPLLVLVEQAQKQAVREAHDAIFDAESVLMQMPDPTGVNNGRLTSEVQNVRERIEKLKELSVQRPGEMESIKAGTAALRVLCGGLRGGVMKGGVE